MFARLLLRFLPWWAYALMALFLLPISISLVAVTLQDIADLSARRDQPQPPPVEVAAFDAAKDIHPAGEVHLRGVLRADLGVVELDKKGVNQSYIVLAGEGPSPRRIALLFPAYQTESILAFLRQAADPQGRITVGGFVAKSGSDAAKVDIDLALRDPGSQLLAVVEPFTGTREAALEDQALTNHILLLIIAVLTLVPILMTVIKFRAARQRRAQKRALATASSGSTKHAPKPAAGEFANGPIISKKGFFR